MQAVENKLVFLVEETSDAMNSSGTPGASRSPMDIVARMMDEEGFSDDLESADELWGTPEEAMTVKI